MTRTSSAQHKGFTLTELLVVLSIICLLALIASPSLHNLYQQAKSRAVAYELYRFMQFARSTAVYKGRVITVCASQDNLNCVNSRNWSGHKLLLFDDKNHNGTREADESLIRILSLSRHSGSLQWRSFGNKPWLQWQSNGMTYFQNGNFLYCPANKKPQLAFQLTLNAAGRLYFMDDKNKDGIVEGSDGKNIQCL